MKLSLKNHNFICLFVLMSFFLGGCAASLKPLAFDQAVDQRNTTDEAVAFLALNVANKHNPKYQPEIDRVIITSAAADEQNGQAYLFEVTDKYREVEKEFNEYLISFQLPPGQYTLESFHADSGPFPVKTAHFSIPLCAAFELEAGQTVYLGRIEASVIERTRDDQLRAGTLFMGLPGCQLLVGAFGGTFVVDISDQFQKDMALFKGQYPFLADCKMENATLSPWVAPADRRCR